MGAAEDRLNKRKAQHKNDPDVFWQGVNWSDARKVVGDKLTYEQFCDHKVRVWTEAKKAGPKARVYIPQVKTAEEALALKEQLARVQARAEAIAKRVKESEALLKK